MFAVISVAESSLEQEILMPSTFHTATCSLEIPPFQCTDKGTTIQFVICVSPQGMWNDNFNVKKYQSKLSTHRASSQQGETEVEWGQSWAFQLIIDLLLPQYSK